jgi:uncharacterized protein (TIGR04551 family)
MRRLLFSSSFVLALSLGLSPLVLHAQEPAEPSTPSTNEAPASPSVPNAEGTTSGTPATGPAPGEPIEPAEPTEPGDAAEAPYDDPQASNPVLEPPNLGPLAVDPNVAAGLPDPGASADRLQQAAPAPAAKRGWTLPETVFHLHGYMRLRGNYLRDGSLGHRPDLDRLPTIGGLSGAPARTNYDPFPFFTPDDSTKWNPNTTEEPVAGGCGDRASTASGRCNKRGQVSGDLRLRLKPEIHLSDDVRVKAWIDVLDNVALGTLGYGTAGQSSDGNALRARRVWGEARNRDIGELRFGRMGADWGLGILDNGGDRYGIDSDFSSEVDRIMGITNLAGFYLMAAYDWASEGKVLGKLESPSGVPVDRAQRDDKNAFTLAAARKLDDEAQQSALARGESVFNYGVYFVYRSQVLQRDVAIADGQDNRYVRLNEKQFIPDLWFQVLWEGLRIELEAVAVAGTLEGDCPRLNLDSGTRQSANEQYGKGMTSELSAGGSCKLRQFGVALETEYRLFDERLGLHFMTGFASGDSDAYGLAATNDSRLQKHRDGQVGDTISTYGFHPDYRVDLILWRTIMRRVAGAYYFKPGVSYDFIRDPYGQLAGGRLDVVYSRASAADQTWGGSANLGLELDASLYYRSEDGPDVMDGFYGLVQFGVLFPFKGLGYDEDELAGIAAPGKKNAMILRGVAGIAF